MSPERLIYENKLNLITHCWTKSEPSLYIKKIMHQEMYESTWRVKGVLLTFHHFYLGDFSHATSDKLPVQETTCMLPV